MPSEALPVRQRAARQAIADNTALARTFIGEMTADDFAADIKTVYSIVRCLEIISEAARRLRGPEQDRFPDLPWRQIEDAGNVYRHVYDRVSTHRVWLTVRNDLPVVSEAALKALAGRAD